MEKITKILLILFCLDMVSTVFALEFVEGAREMNPILNRFENVSLAVIISHIVLIPVIIYTERYAISKNKIKQWTIGATLLSLFLYVVVVNNLLGIIMSGGI